MKCYLHHRFYHFGRWQVVIGCEKLLYLMHTGRTSITSNHHLPYMQVVKNGGTFCTLLITIRLSPHFYISFLFLNYHIWIIRMLFHILDLCLQEGAGLCGLWASKKCLPDCLSKWKCGWCSICSASGSSSSQHKFSLEIFVKLS